MPVQLCQRSAVEYFREPFNNVIIAAVLVYIWILFFSLNNSISANLVSH